MRQSKPVCHHPGTSSGNPALLAALFLCVLVLTACAGTPDSAQIPRDQAATDTNAQGNLKTSTALAESDVQCHNERVTGSHMIQTVCTTASQRKDMEAAAKQWMRTGGRSGGVSRVRDTADPRDTDEDD